MTIQNYAVYRTSVSGSEAAGYVVNAIVWDGVTSYSPGDGLALVADPDGKYPVGSTYAASTS
ncbi:hypothetical protein A0U92_03665 [Acetobacter aceti]|uniref:Uncharacterized protein n=1 Tax=Acetobacter aceti TaxID=435 RepID=A0A1U9KE06_ACEAC|nr:hypothetical protein [Acetobacter aceti]AQS84016.1 hypothetical protein A0U92_03665 [Acetobacter aceti]